MDTSPKRTNPVDVNKLKATLAKLDNDLLVQLLKVAHSALREERSQQRAAAESGISVTRVRGLSNLAFQLSMEPDELPEISTVAELDAFSAKPE